MKIIQRPVTIAVAIALGLVALVASASLVMLSDSGWPWHATISSTPGTASATAEIVDEDGAVYRFAGSPADARHWLDRKQEELKEAHGIPAKIAAGRLLQPLGVALVLLGLAGLTSRAVTVGSSGTAVAARPR